MVGNYSGYGCMARRSRSPCEVEARPTLIGHFLKWNNFAAFCYKKGKFGVHEEAYERIVDLSR